MKKRLLYFGFGVLGLMVIAFVVAALSVGKVVRNRVELMGPEMTKASVTLDGASVWIFPGRAQLSGLIVGNPPPYETKTAFKVETISVRLNPLTILSHKMIIDSITIKSPEVTVEGGLRKNNLTELEQNVDDYLNASTGSGSPASTNAAPARKFQINELVITGAKLHVISVLHSGRDFSMTLPQIRLTQLGAGDDGITGAEIARQTLSALLTSVRENAADALSTLAKDAMTKGKKIDFKKAGEKLKGMFSH
jgi:uncharacterized protein involved in outer membrane biogenesis